jgi:formate dehydrogenase iron-sulfur subunit
MALSATTWRHVTFIEQFERNGNASPGAGDAPSTVPSGSILDALIAPKEGRWLMMSDVCKHCSSAPCQLACPTGALIHNEFADVYIQNDICNGCGYCVAACPFGVITRGELDGHAHKCTLCFDRQRDGLVPACAKACPTESIQFGPIDELRERARKRVNQLHDRGQTDAYLYGDRSTDTYPALHAFFLLLDKPSRYGLPDHPEMPQMHLVGDYLRSALGAIVTLAVAACALTFYAI